MSNNVVYAPTAYHEYISFLITELTKDLKNGRIDEKVFIDTYEKYKQMEADNKKKYNALPTDVKKLVDEITGKVLSKEKECDTIASLRKEIEDLKMSNMNLMAQVESLRAQLLKGRGKWEYPDPTPFYRKQFTCKVNHDE